MRQQRRRPQLLACLLLALAVLVGPSAVPSAAFVPADGVRSVAVPAAAGEAAAPLPDPAVLAELLKKVSRSGIGKVGLVVTTTDGTVLTDRSADTPLTPASTMKVLSTMTALATLSADRTFATRVLDAGSGRIVLVGGGDPLLTDKTSTSTYKLASLQKLAKATAAALKASGTRKVALRYDASLFSGPLWNSSWKSSWKGWEAKVAALEINSGKVSGGRASANPAKTAARAFAKRLAAAGIRVTSVASGRATAAGTELARVTSTTLERIIHRTLRQSDNVAAETLSRHAAIANGRAGSFTGAAANVKAWLSARGLWTSGLKLVDGSGLAPANKLTATVLAAAVRIAVTQDAFAPIVDGFPVAGESGTLKSRFDDPSEKAGRHVVHAKTGTLSGLASLAGYVTTADGATLVFAEIGNKASSYYRVYNWLDREAAVLARCGCR
ncbi:D-alanyl-D-alanine carboxypeptidase/D-alanyl-D-alanine-endopeptidase [Propionicimonas sp.]|uniref:D-alanyl-D-alanine carboxypeptidase/D-alanyl-D-alanine endopeptidase n=1 Tax=Propionicimonas sp. TaxID=1955623 RepID=UPI0039E7143A